MFAISRLPHLSVTHYFTDCSVLCLCFIGGSHVFLVETLDRKGSAVRMEAVRVVHRANDVRQLLWGLRLGSENEESGERTQIL